MDIPESCVRQVLALSDPIGLDSPTTVCEMDGGQEATSCIRDVHQNVVPVSVEESDFRALDLVPAVVQDLHLDCSALVEFDRRFACALTWPYQYGGRREISVSDGESVHVGFEVGELEDALIVGERGGEVAEEISFCITESGGRPRQRFSVLALYVDDEADSPVQSNFSEVREAVAQLDVVED